MIMNVQKATYWQKPIKKEIISFYEITSFYIRYFLSKLFLAFQLFFQSSQSIDIT